MRAAILERPATFDRVDRVKALTGQELHDGDDRTWILGGPLVFQLMQGPGLAPTYTVPRGFTTDGASVPRLAQLLTGWYPWDEPQRWGAIVHDWMYCRPRTAKSYADAAFRAVLLDVGASPFRAQAMYAAVRLFGGHAYRTDQASGPAIYV